MARLGGDRKVWDWPTVNSWLKEHNRFETHEIGLSRVEFSFLDSLLRQGAGRLKFASVPNYFPVSHLEARTVSASVFLSHGASGIVKAIPSNFAYYPLEGSIVSSNDFAIIAGYSASSIQVEPKIQSAIRPPDSSISDSRYELAS
ncbi:MAG: hypothetical protein WDO06_02750 [Actinomycetota bacterium]